MKNLSEIVDGKDIVTKEYVDDKVEVTQTLTSGTGIGLVGGGGTKLYSPHWSFAMGSGDAAETLIISVMN